MCVYVYVYVCVCVCAYVCVCVSEGVCVCAYACVCVSEAVFHQPTCSKRWTSRTVVFSARRRFMSSDAAGPTLPARPRFLSGQYQGG